MIELIKKTPIKPTKPMKDMKPDYELITLAVELVTLRQNKGYRPLREIEIMEDRIEEIETKIVNRYGVEMLEIINESTKV